MLFEVTAAHIASLNDVELRTLIGRLSEEEARARGHSPAGVTWGGHQNASDGGIDVRVSLPASTQISGFVPAAATGFQVKAEDMPRSAILSEMAPKGALRESIKALSAANGAYVIVSSQGSVADTSLTDRKKAMQEAIDAALPGSSIKLDFYDRQRIATWANQHPGLIPWVREKVGSALSGWRGFGDWSSSPAPIETAYQLDGAVRLIGPTSTQDGMTAVDGINEMRQILAQPKGVIRLVGLSGVGKTRLIQALFDARIGTNELASAEAVYTDISSAPDPVPYELASQQISLGRRVILIVDNCGPDLHQKLAAKVGEGSSRLSLITVEYDINDDKPENTNVYKLEAASVELIEKILEIRFPKLPLPTRGVIARFSDGNSRIAFALAATAKDGESLAHLPDSELFRRLFEQSKGKDSELLAAAKACALFYSFDGETLDNGSELSTLAGLVGLTAEKLYGHVAELYRRQLVQKRSKWRAILPHAVAHRLAKLALQDIPWPRIESSIVRDGSERMLKSFSRRIGYLHDDEHAKALAVSWFSKGGKLEPLGKHNELGKALFENVAPIDPEATLAFVERVAAAEPWFFGDQNLNREEIRRTVRLIAYDPALFDRCIALLLRFAVIDARDDTNSAREALKSLFFLYLSGTHATPKQRATFVRHLLESPNEAENTIGQELLRAMLETGHFSSTFSFEFGARSRDHGSNPRKREDITEWYDSALDVVKAVGTSQHKTAASVRKIFASNFLPLCRSLGMLHALVALGETLRQASGWPEGWVSVQMTLKEAIGTCPEEHLSDLRLLAKQLKPSNLADKVRVYALSPDYGALDVSELEDAAEDDPMAARQRVFASCIDLGKELAGDAAVLDALLPEILCTRNVKTNALGQGVALATASLPEMWNRLKQAFLAADPSRRNAGLISGFLCVSAKQDSATTEAFLDELVVGQDFQTFFVECQVEAGLNPQALARMLALLDTDPSPLASFNLLSTGRSNEGFDDTQIRELLLKLASTKDGLHVASEILGMRFFALASDKTPISELMKQTAREMLAALDFESRSHQLDHLAAVMIRHSLDKPEHEPVAQAICLKILTAIRNFKIGARDIGDIIEALAKTFPTTVLDLLVEGGDDELETSRSIFHEGRHTPQCPLRSMPNELVLKWAEEKPATRYAHLAQVIKISETSEKEGVAWSKLADGLISAASKPEVVLNVFFMRFQPTSWSGSRADTMASQTPLLASLLDHPRQDVSEWAKPRLAELKALITAERTREATLDRLRDEKFED